MSSLRRLGWVALAAAAALSPRPAIAQETPGSLFQRLDRDKDGYLSREELAAEGARRGNWIAIDRDRDGRIGRSEFSVVVIAQPRKPPPESAAAGASAAPKE